MAFMSAKAKFVFTPILKAWTSLRPSRNNSRILPVALPDDCKGIPPFPYQAAEKVGFVIPNPRRLPARDLLFARKPRKKQIPHPVQKPNGVRNDIFLSFF